MMTLQTGDLHREAEAGMNPSIKTTVVESYLVPAVSINFFTTAASDFIDPGVGL
jgi:hypothetical protein